MFKNYTVTIDKEEILLYLEYNSKYLYNIVKKGEKKDYKLFRKYLTHSDLLTKGKCSKTLQEIKNDISNDDYSFLKDYVLYYESYDEMLKKFDKFKELNKKQKKYKEDTEEFNNIEKEKEEEISKIRKYIKVARQSNINIPDSFFTTLEIQKTKGKNLCEDISIYIPADSLDFFNVSDFKKIIKKNGKKSDYKIKNEELIRKDEKEEKIKLDNLTFASHGIGIKKNKTFDYLRSMTFKGDVLNILINLQSKEIYIFFERNEMYFEILKIKKPIWAEYKKEDKKLLVTKMFLEEINKGKTNIYDISDETQKLFKTKIFSEEINKSRPNFYIISNETQKLLKTKMFLEEKNNSDEEQKLLKTKIFLAEKDKSDKIQKIINEYEEDFKKTIQNIKKRLNKKDEKISSRFYQKKWKETLIKLDAAKFGIDGYAVCAISKIKGSIEKLGSFFVASHIKPLSECVKEEDYESAFSPYNGFILCSNIDSLFDNFLISIDEDGKICKNDAVNSIKPKNVLKIPKKIDKVYLEEKRIEFLKFHKKEFNRVNGIK